MQKRGRSKVKNFTAKARENARQRIRDAGLSLGGFAKRYDLNFQTLLAVLNGKNKGSIGKGHKAAVALGLKKEKPLPPPITTSRDAYLRLETALLA